MMRWVILSLLVVLGGCFVGGGKRGTEGVAAIYDFGPPPVAHSVTGKLLPWGIEVKAPLWFDTQNIAYRLTYLDGARLREYSQARWAGSATQLIQQRLQQHLHVASGAQGGGSCLLRVEVAEFSHVFVTPEQSAGVLQGKAWLVDKARRPIANLDLQLRQAALTPDARGGVGALIVTVDALADALRTWEQRLMSEGRLGSCGGA